uniref:Uncharacterized protein n=1 Tax=Romanomermis culicivorax TaxID=13658 RepID=A0A915J9H3_ROMCU
MESSCTPLSLFSRLYICMRATIQVHKGSSSSGSESCNVNKLPAKFLQPPADLFANHSLICLAACHVVISVLESLTEVVS